MVFDVELSKPGDELRFLLELVRRRGLFGFDLEFKEGAGGIPFESIFCSYRPGDRRFALLVVHPSPAPSFFAGEVLDVRSLRLLDGRLPREGRRRCWLMGFGGTRTGGGLARIALSRSPSGASFFSDPPKLLSVSSSTFFGGDCAGERSCRKDGVMLRLEEGAIAGFSRAIGVRRGGTGVVSRSRFASDHSPFSLVSTAL